MEHEYYTGLSIFVMVYYATTRFGPKIATWLDKEVDVSICTLLFNISTYISLFLSTVFYIITLKQNF